MGSGRALLEDMERIAVAGRALRVRDHGEECTTELVGLVVGKTWQAMES